MKCHRIILGALALGAVVMMASPAKAVVIAYEGFEGVGDGTLVGTAATGSGFTGNWDATNGDGAASTTEAAGLSYPGSYTGSNVAIGGNGRVTGATTGNAFVALDLATPLDNTSGRIYISWLAQNVAESASVTNTDINRSLFDLAADYPRNSGIRLMTAATGNSALGSIGNSGNWTGGGQSAYGDGELDPEVVDTWGVFQFNDVHNLFTGNGGTQDAAGGSNYNPLPDNYKNVDHLVLTINTATSAYILQVNPQADGTNEGELRWIHTDGDVVDFAFGAFGLEGGNPGDSSGGFRPAGDMVIDEIRIADSFVDAAGFVQIPEPTSALLALCGLLGLGLRRRS